MTPRQHGPLSVTVTNDPMFQVNTLLLWPDGQTDCWVVDPGFKPAAQVVLQQIDELGLTPTGILLTHGHGDHIAGVGTVREAYEDVPIIAPTGDAHMLTDANANLSAGFGMSLTVPAATQTVAPGDTLKLGELEFNALDVSGHSPGGLAYYCAAAGLVIAGDALFASGIGRTDFPGGSLKQLLANIREQLLTLPDETVVYSGHGPTTTVAQERDSNPYLRPGFVG